MQRGVPPKIIGWMQCNCLLEKLGNAETAIVQNYGYQSAKKLSDLKAEYIDILVKTICSPGEEHTDGTRDPGICISYMTQQVLTSAFLMLYHRTCCDMLPSNPSWTFQKPTSGHLHFLVCLARGWHG